MAMAMPRRGRIAKIQAAQPVNPSPAVPNSQTLTLVIAQDVNSIGTTSSDVKKVEDKRRKNARTTTLVVRRSERLNSPTRVSSIEPVVVVVEGINIPEAEKEENNSRPDAQAATQPSPVETTRVANLNYRSMYIDSQKKVRSLIKKNRQLRRNLKFAHGKIQVYAEMTPIVSSLSKANEILCNRPWSMRRLRT